MKPCQHHHLSRPIHDRDRRRRQAQGNLYLTRILALFFASESLRNGTHTTKDQPTTPRGKAWFRRRYIHFRRIYTLQFENLRASKQTLPISHIETTVEPTYAPSSHPRKSQKSVSLLTRTHVRLSNPSRHLIDLKTRPAGPPPFLVPSTARAPQIPAQSSCTAGMSRT